MSAKFAASSLSLYALAVLSTMAGMEIFGWLSFALVLSLAVYHRRAVTASDAVWPRRPLLEKSDWALLTLFVVIVLSALIAAPAGSDTVFIIGNSRFILLFIALRFGLEFFGLRRTWNVFRFLVCALAVISVYAIVQHFTGIDFIRGHREPVSKVYFTDVPMPDGKPLWSYRARGMWGHPVTFGHSIALSFCMVLGAAFAVPWKKPTGGLSQFKLLAIATAALAGMSLVFSYTRGAWLAAAAAVFVMALYLGRRIAIPLAIASAVGFSALFAASPTFRSRIESITSTTNQSNAERLDVWRANIEMFKQHPVLGVGYGVNEDLITEYYDKLGIKQEFGGHAHNNYLQFLSGTGVLGFSAFLLFSLLMFWQAHQLLLATPKENYSARALALGAMGAMVALNVGGLTECNFKDAEVNHQYMLILAVLTMLWRQAKVTAPSVRS